MNIVRKSYLREAASLVESGKQVIANPDLYGITPYVAALDEVSGVNTITLTGNGQGTRMVSNGYNGIMDFYNMMMSATSSEFTVFIRNTSKGREYMNRAIHANTIFGSGQRPFVLTSPFILEPSAAINIDFVDLSGSSNTIYLAYSGNLYQNNTDRATRMFNRMNGNAKAVETPYFYGFDSGYVQLSAGATTTAYITIQGNSDFFLERVMQQSTGAFNVQIQDSSNSVRWTSGISVRSSALFGTATDHWLFYPPKFLPRSTQISVTLTDTSGSTNNIYLTFAGKHYYDGGA